MNVRRIPAVAGRIGWVRDMETFPLPSSLVDGDEVSVLDATPYGEVEVRDRRGTRYKLLKVQVDAGNEYEIAPGDWRHESDSEVLTRLRDLLVKLRTSESAPGSVPAMNHAIDLITRILIRNSVGSDSCSESRS